MYLFQNRINLYIIVQFKTYIMKNIKDITISIFAVIGFVAIIAAFTNQPEQANQTITPESHIYEMYVEGNSPTRGFK